MLCDDGFTPAFEKSEREASTSAVPSFPGRRPTHVFDARYVREYSMPGNSDEGLLLSCDLRVLSPTHHRRSLSLSCRPGLEGGRAGVGGCHARALRYPSLSPSPGT